MSALERPGIFLMGPRRAGKSSIAKVIFSKMAPHETLFLEPSTILRVYTIATNPYMQFSIWDWPGDYEWQKGQTIPVAASTSASGDISSGSYLGSASMSHDRLLASSASLSHSIGGAASSVTSRSHHGGSRGRGGGAEQQQCSLAGSVKALLFDDPQDECLLPQGSGLMMMDGGLMMDAGAGAGGGGMEATLSELDCLLACSSVVFVIDAAEEEPPYTEAVEALKRLAGALMALARKKAALYGGSLGAIPGATHSNPFALPSIEFFCHKLDSDAFASSSSAGGSSSSSGPAGSSSSSSAAGGGAGRPEARTELLRELGSVLGQELTDAGFSVSGIPGFSSSSSSSSGHHHQRGGMPIGSGAGGHRGSVSSSSSSSSQAVPIGSGGGAGSSSSSASGAASIGVITGPVPLTVSFHLTSVHDHSLFESFSRVVQRVTPGPLLMPSCENLLNGLQAAIGAEKVFLLDLVTKLFYCSDSNPVQESSYELCSAMIETCNDVSAIYDPSNAHPGNNNGNGNGDGHDQLGGGGGGGLAEALGRKGSSSSASPLQQAPPVVADDAGRCSLSLIRLSDGTGLYLREVSPNLGVVAIVKDREPPMDETSAANHHLLLLSHGHTGDGETELGLGEASAPDAGGAGPLSTGGGGGAGRRSLGGARSAGRGGGADETVPGGVGGATPAAFIPRSCLSFADRALADYNIRVFAGALAKIFALKLGIGRKELAAAGVALPASLMSSSMLGDASGSMMMATKGINLIGPGASLMPPGSYPGMPLSPSVAKSSYQGASFMTAAAPASGSTSNRGSNYTGSYRPEGGAGPLSSSYRGGAGEAMMIGGRGAAHAHASHGAASGGGGGGLELGTSPRRTNGPSGADLLMQSRGR